MLDTLDVALAFVTVMLAVSLIIMSLTQAVAAVLGLRGARLRRGLTELITQAAPGLTARIVAKEKTLDTFVDKVLQHGLISDSAVTNSGRLGRATVIKREELIPVINAVLADSKLAALADDEIQRLESWFDSFMTRVSQWFVMNTRWITVAFAVVIGIGVHLDAIALVERLRSDKEMRARLEGMSASLLDQTPEALDKLQHVYRDTLKTFAAEQSARLTQQPAEADLTRITSRSDAAQWIQAHAAEGQSASELATAYDAALDATLEAGLQKSLDRATTIRQQLVASGLPGMSAGPGGRWALPQPAQWPGILVSILFLSLGAPFWFNVLKNLTSLKSVVARNEAAPEAARPRSFTTADSGRLRELVAPPTSGVQVTQPDDPAPVP